MKITLCDLNHKLCAEWERAFAKVDNVRVKNQDIFATGRYDCIVSPSNSYGFMDGGIDGVYTKHFGSKLQKDLQDKIKALPMKELLVGQTLVIETGDKDISHMISAPTMRVPLDVSSTANPYLAFRASLCAAQAEGFKTIICPGLGTLTGNVEAGDCARQMYAAYADFVDKFPKYPASIREAYLKHLSLVGTVNIKGKR